MSYFDYSPFGKVARSYESGSLVKYTYTGQERDAETGLMNYKARMYDPNIGRFYAMDPAGQTPSFYNYCANNPVSFTDPTGEFLDPITWMVIIGSTIGAIEGHQIGKESGAKGWNLALYTLAGGTIGAFSGYTGGLVATSSLHMAGTLGLATGSTISSIGNWGLSGGKRDFTTSLGFGSMNWSKGRFDYFMDGNNSVGEDVGYFLGGLTNLTDLVNWNKSDLGELEVKTKKTGVSHTSVQVVKNPEIKVSFGPENNKSDLTNIFSKEYWAGFNRNRIETDAISQKVTGNIKNFTAFSNWLSEPTGPFAFIGNTYVLPFNNCATNGSLALNAAGIFNVPIPIPWAITLQVSLYEHGIIQGLERSSYLLQQRR